MSVVDLLMDRMNDAKKSYEQSICNGQMVDYPSYRNACGVIEGINRCQEELTDILQEQTG